MICDYANPLLDTSIHRQVKCQGRRSVYLWRIDRINSQEIQRQISEDAIHPLVLVTFTVAKHLSFSFLIIVTSDAFLLSFPFFLQPLDVPLGRKWP